MERITGKYIPPPYREGNSEGKGFLCHEGEAGGRRGGGREGGRRGGEGGERENECLCAYLVLPRSRENRNQRK